MFEYYTTFNNVKFPYADGVFYATDAEAQENGYPIHGGYPDSPLNVFSAGGGSSPKVQINYLQSTSKELTFPNRDLTGLSAPSMEYINLHTFKNFFNSTVSDAKRVCDVLDVPRVLAVGGDTFL